MTIEEKLKEMENAREFLIFIERNGFDPKNYEKILELGNAPDTSMAVMLRTNQPFLLSCLATPESLKKAGILGMPGDIKNGEIIYPDQKVAAIGGIKNRIAEYPTHPRLKRFDAIISRGITKRAFDTVGTPQDKFIGFCTDIDDPSYDFRLMRAQNLLEKLNTSPNEYEGGYELITNETSILPKRMCLIKRKGIN